MLERCVGDQAAAAARRSSSATRRAPCSSPAVLGKDRLDGLAGPVPSTDSVDDLIDDRTVKTGLRDLATGLLRHVREFAPGVSADGQEELLVGLATERHRSEPAIPCGVDGAAVSGLLDKFAQRRIVVVDGHGAGHRPPLLRYGFEHTAGRCFPEDRRGGTLRASGATVPDGAVSRASGGVVAASFARGDTGRFDAGEVERLLR